MELGTKFVAAISLTFYQYYSCMLSTCLTFTSNKNQSNNMQTVTLFLNFDKTGVSYMDPCSLESASVMGDRIKTHKIHTTISTLDAKCFLREGV